MEEPAPPEVTVGDEAVSVSAAHGRKRLVGLVRSAWPLPAAAWVRCLLLFCSLVLIKLAVAIQMREHLAQTHYRLGGQGENWVGAAAFYLFVALGVWSVVEMGNACRAAGVKALRAGNAAILGLGLLFIFLTFHAGSKNYLYPIMDRVLRWSSLAPYLALDLFFHPPYLAAWIGGYVLVFYFVARSGRESWTPYLTALVAGGYGLMYLRELEACRDELLLADCLGVASLLAATRGGKTETVRGVLLPVLWVIFAWAGFRYCNGFQAADPYFVLLAADSLVLFGGLVLWAARWGFLGAWRARMPFFFASFLLLTNTHYPGSGNYNNLLCWFLEFPHYFWGELGVVVLVALGARAYALARPRGRWWGLDLLCLLLIALALADFRLCQIMGVRLEWSVLSFGDSPKMMWRLARSYLPAFAAGLGLLSGVYFLALRLLLRRQGATVAPDWAGPQRGCLMYWVACLVLLGVVGSAVRDADNVEGQALCQLVRTCPLWPDLENAPLGRDEFLQRAKSLGLGDFKAAVSTPAGREITNMNVVLVFMESSYNQHLSLFGSAEETQPLLSKYKDRMELFPNFFSNFAGSMNARFAAFTSLYPARECRRFTLERVKVKSLFEVLHDHGYTCSLFYSSFLDYTGFRDFLRGRGLDEMYDADTMPGRRATEPLSWGLREEETLGAMRARIQNYATNQQPFFLTYVPVAPHFPYDGIPRQFMKFKPTEMGDSTPFYLNELLCLDWVMASIVDQLKDSGLLDHTLVIITNDHGEMLGAKGGPTGHGWALTPELANTPLIVMDPRNPGYHLNHTPGSQVDLLPTVLDRLGIPVPADELYEGRSLSAGQRNEKQRVYLNTFQQYAVMSGNRLAFGQRSADPGAQDVPRGVYVISNQGSKTLFAEEGAAPSPPCSIRAFDDFQENLLRHYSLYRDRLRRGQTYTRR